MDPLDKFFENIVESETKPFFKVRLEGKLKGENRSQSQRWWQVYGLELKPALLVSLILLINLLAIFMLESGADKSSQDFAEEFGFYQNLDEGLNLFDQ